MQFYSSDKGQKLHSAGRVSARYCLFHSVSIIKYEGAFIYLDESGALCKSDWQQSFWGRSG